MFSNRSKQAPFTILPMHSKALVSQIKLVKLKLHDSYSLGPFIIGHRYRNVDLVFRGQSG